MTTSSSQKDDVVAKGMQGRLGLRLAPDLLSPKLMHLSSSGPAGQAGCVCVLWGSLFFPFPFLAGPLRVRESIWHPGIWLIFWEIKNELSHAYVLHQKSVHNCKGACEGIEV